MLRDRAVGLRFQVAPALAQGQGLFRVGFFVGDEEGLRVEEQEEEAVEEGEGWEGGVLYCLEQNWQNFRMGDTT